MAASDGTVAHKLALAWNMATATGLRGVKAGSALALAALVALSCISTPSAPGQAAPRTIHVFVALCDNEHQGIVPVPARLGNGDDPANNLYWGAAYGVRTFFQRSADWELLKTIERSTNRVLERCVFKHKAGNAYLVADAYRGIEIKQTVIDFLEAASGNNEEVLSVEADSKVINLQVGGAAQLVVYVGHNGLMDFHLDPLPRKRNEATRDAIILACKSKSYFLAALREAGANPLLWTTGLMSPEAYTLKGAIDGWILNEASERIRMRAAQAYHKYQKCGLNAARRLLVTGR